MAYDKAVPSVTPIVEPPEVSLGLECYGYHCSAGVTSMPHQSRVRRALANNYI